MAELEEMLQNVLSDPSMMQKIMGLAQSLGAGEEKKDAEGTSTSQSAPPLPDLESLGQLSGLLKQTGLDQHQKDLLTALSPYMSDRRISKLRRAMQAAKMAGLASSALGRNLSPGR